MSPALVCHCLVVLSFQVSFALSNKLNTRLFMSFRFPKRPANTCQAAPVTDAPKIGSRVRWSIDKTKAALHGSKKGVKMKDVHPHKAKVTVN